MVKNKQEELLKELLGESIDLCLQAVKTRYFEHLVKAEEVTPLEGLERFNESPFRMLRIAFDQIEKEFNDKYGSNSKWI